jgi:hypothetical protein
VLYLLPPPPGWCTRVLLPQVHSARLPALCCAEAGVLDSLQHPSWRWAFCLLNSGRTGPSLESVPHECELHPECCLAAVLVPCVDSSDQYALADCCLAWWPGQKTGISCLLLVYSPFQHLLHGSAGNRCCQHWQRQCHSCVLMSGWR